MISTLALAATAALSADTCIDHTSYTFGFAESRLRDVVILRDEAGGRAERGTYPDGTVVTLSADYCTEREVALSMDAPADAQNIMRLRQVFGQFDRYATCPISDWSGFDAAMDAVGVALDSGESYDNGGEPIDGDGVNAIYLTIAPSGERIAATIRCVRPND